MGNIKGNCGLVVS